MLLAATVSEQVKSQMSGLPFLKEKWVIPSGPHFPSLRESPAGSKVEGKSAEASALFMMLFAAESLGCLPEANLQLNP